MLLDALNARRGIVCTVGAGGKKTTLYRLAGAFSGRLGLTATVPTLPVPDEFRDSEVVGETDVLADEVVAASHQARRVAFAKPSDKPPRLGGIPPELVEEIHARAGFDATYVKADGARMRWIKAPSEHEPQIPLSTATVIPIVSARALGEALSERIAHRPELVAAVTGAKIGELLSPIHLGRLLASPDGALRRTGDAIVVPLINMVDDDGMLVAAREAARHALSLSRRFDRVVLARMNAPEPIVEVVGARIEIVG